MHIERARELGQAMAMAINLGAYALVHGRGVEITDKHSTLHLALKMQSFTCKNNLETYTHMNTKVLLVIVALCGCLVDSGLGTPQRLVSNPGVFVSIYTRSSYIYAYYCRKEESGV